MGYTDWQAPTFSPYSIPTLPSLSFSEGERQIISYLLSQRSSVQYQNMVTTNAYYMGAQAIPNLKIAIPDDLAAQLRTLVGWAEPAVNPYVELLHVAGFRLPGEIEVSEELAQIWDDNGMDAEFPIATTDALAEGQAWFLGGVNDDGSSRVTVESPLSVSADFSLDGRTVKSLISTYKGDDQRERFTLMLPDRTIHAAQNDRNEWEIAGVDDHDFGVVTAVRMVNRARSDNRDGYSEITPALMSIIDSACRRSMGLEGSSELYSLPRMLFLGASAEDFQNADGTARRVWDAYINKINMIERDEDGAVPEVHQLTAYDPSVFTKVLQEYRSQAAGITKATPQELGLYTEGNPISVESLKAAETPRTRRARLMQRSFAPSIVRVMQMAVALQHNGVVPDDFRRIETAWSNLTVDDFPAMANGISQLTATGSLPRRSNVVYDMLGLSPVQRSQIAQEWETQDTNDILNQLDQNAAGGSNNGQQPTGEPTNTAASESSANTGSAPALSG